MTPEEKVDLCDRFVKVFRGRSDVYGSAKGFCVNEQLSGEVFLRHLTSTNPDAYIGVYCMIGDLCSWGCIDIDGKDFPITYIVGQDGPERVEGQWDWQAMWTLACNLHRVLAVKQVPAHIERSKNGYHVWVFPQEPLIKAATMRRALMAACVAISYSPKEVNPKAEGPRKGTKGYGNFVRLPYRGYLVNGKDEERVMVDGLQGSMWLEDFLDAVENGGRAETSKLEAIAALWVPPPEPTHGVDYEAGLDDEATQRLIKLLGGKTFIIWRDGPFEGKDRSTTLAKLAYELRDDGLTAKQAFAVMKSADARWGKFQDRPEELGRLIERAYQ